NVLLLLGWMNLLRCRYYAAAWFGWTATATAILLWIGCLSERNCRKVILRSDHIAGPLSGAYVWLAAFIVFSFWVTWLYLRERDRLHQFTYAMSERDLFGDTELGSSSTPSRHLADRKDIDGTETP